MHFCIAAGQGGDMFNYLFNLEQCIVLEYLLYALCSKSTSFSSCSEVKCIIFLGEVYEYIMEIFK